MAKHADLAVGSIHIPYQWSYANAAARTGAGGFVAGDVGKFARQTDDDSIWMLTATTPTWTQVNSTASGAPTSASYVTTAAEAGLSAEVVHPELADLNAAGATNVDLSSPATGTGVTASVSNGCYHLAWTNNSFQYWDVVSAIGTGDFDVRMRLVSAKSTGYSTANNGPLFIFALTDTSRTTGTKLGVQIVAGGWGSVTPTVQQMVGTTGGNALYGIKVPCILRIARTGTTVTFYYSDDEGRIWTTLGTTTSSLNIAKIGAWMHINGNASCGAVVHWIRSF